MNVVLAYYSPIDRWRGIGHAELSQEQQALNAGARRIYAARRRQFAEAVAPHPGRALPALFVPKPLRMLPAPDWVH